MRAMMAGVGLVLEEASNSFSTLITSTTLMRGTVEVKERTPQLSKPQRSTASMHAMKLILTETLRCTIRPLEPTYSRSLRRQGPSKRNKAVSSGS
jgi:hypothetical protein